MGFIPTLPTAGEIQKNAAARVGINPTPTVAECRKRLIISDSFGKQRADVMIMHNWRLKVEQMRELLIIRWLARGAVLRFKTVGIGTRNGPFREMKRSV